MARYERSSRGEPRRGSSNRGPQRRSRDRDDRRDSYSDRGGRDSYSDRGGRDRRDVTMTKVTCSSCGEKCEVPFKPTSDKPVYCDDCFSKKESPNKVTGKDIGLINEKLDKIMKALKIE